MMRWLLTCLMAVVPIAGIAATTGEEDAITVNRLNASDFEVLRGVFTGTSEYFWCGAGSYVERRSGLPGSTEIYVKRPLGPSVTQPGEIGVVFSLSPAEVPEAANGLTLEIDRAGVSRSATIARQYCRDAFTRSTK